MFEIYSNSLLFSMHLRLALCSIHRRPREELPVGIAGPGSFRAYKPLSLVSGAEGRLRAFRTEFQSMPMPRCWGSVPNMGRVHETKRRYFEGVPRAAQPAGAKAHGQGSALTVALRAQMV